MNRGRTLLATLVAVSLLCGTRLEAQPAPVPAPAPAAPTPNRYVYLIRHGDYDRVDNADDRVANGLNAVGREQAELLGKRLAALPVRMTSIVSSNYTRAMETADILGHVLGLPVERDTLLHECTPTTTRTDYMRNHSAEEIAGCDANLEAAWAKYIRPSADADGRDLVVCHGNVIRWFVTKALGGHSDQWHLMDIGNASITVIVVRSDGSLKVASFSDVGHLPPDKQSWTGRGAGYAVPPPRKP